MLKRCIFQNNKFVAPNKTMIFKTYILHPDGTREKHNNKFIKEIFTMIKYNYYFI